MRVNILILFLAEGAAMLDLREGRIPNGWILTGVLLGLAELHLISGIRDYRSGLLSALLPFLLLFPFFLFRMIGAGDIKLLMLVGFFMNPREILECLFLSFLFAAIYAACFFLCAAGNRKRYFSGSIRHLQHYIQGVLQNGERPAYWKQSRPEERLHMAVFIFFAVIPWAAGLY
ncbi:MAG: prepilin peptidase [Bilifractor sp.]